MSNVKRIGVLTSGGDAPGMNAAVRAVVRTALHEGMEVVGFNRGYNGLLHEDYRMMDLRSVSNIIEEGGTVLYSARCDEFKEPENVKKSVKFCKELGIEGMVVIGGDGSFRGARDLSENGLPCVGIPATIDNDISSTQFCLGFDTALNTVVENIDRLRDTTQSHDRCSVVEVMGRDCGELALHAAISTGATALLVGEVEFDVQKDVIDRINKSLEIGKTNFIVIVSEGVNFKHKELTPDALAKTIEKETGVETRATVLGHIQRGGSPTGRDRVLGSEFGNYAVKLLLEGKGDLVVASVDNKLTNFDILKALKEQEEHGKQIDMDLFEVSKVISI